MKLVTSAQMKNIDAQSIETYHIPGLELMERAGLGTAELCKKLLGDPKGKKVFVFCGKGNNGGDGLVVGRYLTKWKAKVQIFLLSKKDELKGDPRTNLNKAIKFKLPIRQVIKLEDLPEELNCHLIVDAIFGTGFKGEVSGLEKEVIQKINSSRIPVVAVDIPSGLNADTGKFHPVCVKATATTTMGFPKIGQFFFPGKEYCGDVTVAEIGLSPRALEEEKIDLNLMTEPEVKSFLPARPGHIHKGDCGKIFVLAGSVGYTGAACLASLSALRSGAGLVVLGVPQSLNSIFEAKLTEVITRPLPDVGQKGHLALRGLGEIKPYLDWADCLAIGPGLGQHFQTFELVRRLITTRINKPLVLDADGLNAFARQPEMLKDLPFPLIITPHPGELSRLIGQSVAEIEKKRVDIARQTAQDFNLVLVLKGAPTVIAEPGGQVYVNPTGNSGMATAGCGDVLTGIITGLMAQKLMLEKDKPVSETVLESALAGVYLHGLAGDLAKASKTPYSMIAGDIQEKIPEAFAKLTL